MIIKALDPSKRTGWAIWGDGMDAPRCGVLDFAASSEGACYARARVKLSDFLRSGDLVAIEEPILPAGVSIASRLALFGIRALILERAFCCGAEVVEVTTTQWRSRFLGVTQAPKHIEGKERRRRWIKQRAIDEVEARGWGTVSNDEADAIGIADYIRQMRDRDYAAAAGPLFRQRA